MRGIATAVLALAALAGSVFAAGGECVIQFDKNAGGIRVGESTLVEVERLFGAPSARRHNAVMPRWLDG